jgi:hypothetical protein
MGRDSRLDEILEFPNQFLSAAVAVPQNYECFRDLQTCPVFCGRAQRTKLVSPVPTTDTS